MKHWTSLMDIATHPPRPATEPVTLVPVDRSALTNNVINSRRPFPTLQNVNIFEPIGKAVR